MRSCFLLLLLTLSFGIKSSFAQNNQRMQVWQDSLLTLGNAMFSEVAEPERLENNFNFIKTLVSALKEANSFFFEFDQLKMISVLSAPDKSFRIFSWNIPLQDGSYLYYGTIQHKVPGGKLKLTPLLDKTFEIANPDQDVTKADKWYGAQYYQLIPISSGQYALLGWKGHHADYTKKVIEILHIDVSGEVSFGVPLFTDDPQAVRKIFSYTKAASMFLQYNVSAKQIEFDHIVPAAPQLKGNYKYYGPDLSYDGYVLENGKLLFKEDIEVHNPTQGNENRFIDPTRLSDKLKSGL